MRTFITIDEASNLTDGQLKASTIRVYASPQQKTFTMYRVGAKEFVDKDEFLTDLTPLSRKPQVLALRLQEREGGEGRFR